MKVCDRILTGIFAAGKTPIALLLRRSSDLFFVPSVFPIDSGKPSSSPKLKPMARHTKYTNALTTSH